MDAKTNAQAEYEARKERERAEAQAKLDARVKEIHAGIKAALKAAGVKFRADSDNHWYNIGESTPTSISVRVLTTSRSGTSRFSYVSEAQRWSGMCRVQLGGYGGVYFHESKASAKKSGSTRESDFDYAAIAEALAGKHQRALSETRHAEKLTEASTAGTAALKQLGVKRSEQRYIYHGSDCTIVEGLTVAYDIKRPSYELEFKVSVDHLTQEEAATVIEYLRTSLKLPRED